MTDLWENKQVRSMYDPTTGGYWFSATDICAAITGSDYRTASGYWRKLKNTKNKFQVVTESNYLKLKAPNGKYHFAEVIGFKSVIKLIQTCPSPNANAYRLWLADMLFDGITAAQLEQELAKYGEVAAGKTLAKYTGDPKEQYVRLVSHKETII